jgi:mannose-6-phosphate isomerase-like protein (cupin superfamily)
MITWFKNLFKKKEVAPPAPTFPWGEKKVLVDLPHLKVAHFWVDATKSTETYTTQDLTSKTWLFVKGNGDYQNGAMKKKILPGTNASISAGAKHAIMAGGDRVEVLEVQSGEPFVPAPAQLPASTASESENA